MGLIILFFNTQKQWQILQEPQCGLVDYLAGGLSETASLKLLQTVYQMWQGIENLWQA